MKIIKITLEKEAILESVRLYSTRIASTIDGAMDALALTEDEIKDSELHYKEATTSLLALISDLSPEVNGNSLNINVPDNFKECAISELIRDYLIHYVLCAWLLAVNPDIYKRYESYPANIAAIIKRSIYQRKRPTR